MPDMVTPNPSYDGTSAGKQAGRLIPSAAITTYSRLMPSLDSGEPAGTLQTLLHDTRFADRSDRSATSISVQPVRRTQPQQKQHTSRGGSRFQALPHVSAF